jgi:DNA ligase D-like protein (predicted ligase)
MLARRGEPFDSDEHLFEIKWDGTRAQARITDGGYLLTNRNRRDLTTRYPELAFLADLEPGLILDGEIVVMRDGRPDFELLLSREQTRNPHRIRAMSQSARATLVAFDLLYRNGRSLMAAPLVQRRAALAEIIETCTESALALSDGVVGEGIQYFEAASTQQLEGIMSKRLASPYAPGKRSADWLKIKQTHRLHCAIIGYLSENRDVRSLIIATQLDGELRCVGKVGSGLTTAMRARLAGLLAERHRDAPLIECEIDGVWVEPGLYCIVSYLERTRAGHLRAPVFIDLVVDE